METNSVDTISTTLQTLEAVAKQIEAQPLSVILIICLLVFGAVLKLLFSVGRNVGYQLEKEGFVKAGKLARITSGCLIQLIPIFVLVTGCRANLLIAEPGKVAQCPNPQFVIMMWGICLGVVAWVSHATIVRRFEKYIPLLGGKPENGSLGNTDLIKNPDADKSKE